MERMIEGRLLVKLKLPKNIIAGENIDSRPSMVELSKYLKPFPAKARTIRQQISRPPVLDSPDVSIRDQDNNHSPQVWDSEASVQPDLLDSCRGSSSGEEVEEEEEEEEDLGSSDDSGKLKRKLVETENGPGRGDHKIQKTDYGVDYSNISDTEGADDHDGETKEPEIDKNSTSSREGCTDDQLADIKNQVASSPMAPNTPKIYICSFCSKTFSSHLAFGGHKSSHTKFKMVIYNAIDHRRKKQHITNTCHQETGKIASSEKNAATPESAGDDRTHTCKICFQKFSSGQALGGHRRCHWLDNMSEQKTQYAPKILNFDLNELPKEEDEDPSSKC